MLTYPQIDPTIFSIGPIQLRWYSLMYIIGLSAAYFFLRYSSRKGTLKFNYEEIESVMGYTLLGMILGARLVYVLVYNLPHYLDHPGEILAVWKGGLSFHGALLGICLSLWWFCHKHNKSFFNLMDHSAVVAPIGLGFGRIGNFINGELWGRVTDSPLGMVFPDGGPLPRHPSQLYESCLEGWLLFAFMLTLYYFKPKQGVISACFLIGYGTVRFFVEFFREPDSQLGTILGPFSMGQLLCAIMWMIGGVILIYSLNQNVDAETAPMKGVSRRVS